MAAVEFELFDHDPREAGSIDAAGLESDRGFGLEPVAQLEPTPIGQGVSIGGIGAMIHWMTKTYGAEQPLSQCVALAAFAGTPLLLVGVVQLYPLATNDSRAVHLEIKNGDAWKRIATEEVRENEYGHHGARARVVALLHGNRLVVLRVEGATSRV